MKENKRNLLKKSVRLNLLAAYCEISPMTLSRIIHNRLRPSQILAEKLAEGANKMCFSDEEEYFKPEDFIPGQVWI